MTRKLSPVMEDYLKAIFYLSRKKQQVTTKDLASYFDVKPSTVTQTLHRLADLQLINYQPYRGVTLTELGRKIALEIIRHHRLIEKYLHDVLGIPWHLVHEEADRWEHVISEEVEQKIAESLGNPDRDPHGAPIPGPDLTLQEEHLELLSEIRPGKWVQIVQVADEDPSLLLYLEERNLLPDTRVYVADRESVSGDLWIVVHGKRYRVAYRAACEVWVRPLDE